MASMLDKYGVPLPSGRNQSMSQPKVKHKFRVTMFNFGIDVFEKDYIALDADEVDRPSVTFDTHRLNYFNGNTKYIGKHNWNPINLVIRDSVNNLSAKAIVRQLQKQLDFQRRITNKNAQLQSSYKFRMMIETLGGANPTDSWGDFGHDLAVDIGTAITNNAGLVNSVDKLIGGDSYNSSSTIDKWVCFGCSITDISWDTLNYSSSQYVTIKLTIDMDNCVQYDMIKEMVGAQIDSLLPDEVNDVLNVLDNVFI